MKSMTGYGKAKKTNQKFEVTIEIKSVNNRYLDILFRMPNNLTLFEAALRDLVKKTVNRGKISIFIELKAAPGENSTTIINEEKLNHYYKSLLHIKKSLNIDEPVGLQHLLQFQELFDTEINDVDENELFSLLKEALLEALDAFNAMRKKEGQHLRKDMSNRLQSISSICTEVKKVAPQNVKKEFKKLLGRLEELIDNQKIDRDRFEQEIALISDKVDISEELTRLQSHITQFEQTLQHDAELGKKLTFILQEMHREANTINSKTTDVAVSHKVISLKEEIEKIREQTQNIE